jgi:hypothetical protein
MQGMAFRSSVTSGQPLWNVAAMGLLGLLGACSGDSLERAAVSGTVRFNGESIPDGRIAFYPTGETTGPPSVGKIRDGRYAIEAAEGPVVGHHRVEIQGLRKTGEMIPDMSGQARTRPNPELVDRVLPYIPPEFNIRSRLSRQIVPGDQELDFDLKAQTVELPAR